MKITAKYKEYTINADGSLNIVFCVDGKESHSTRKYLSKLAEKTADILDIGIAKHREQRSQRANAYLWELCEKLSIACSTKGAVMTSRDVYKTAIFDVGIYKDLDIANKAVDTLVYLWERQGIGWVTEVERGEMRSTVRAYYGSSVYNKTQMGRLIEYIIQECQQVGIETRTPNEIADMLSVWETGC